LCSHSIISRHFMEPEGSLPHSQELPTCPCPEPDQFSRYHPILSLQDPRCTHLYLGLPSGLFTSDFRTNNLLTFLFSPTYATCPDHITQLYLIIRITLSRGLQVTCSSLCSSLHPPATFSLFGPNVPLSTLF
jgi:hypothetical protein